MNSSRIGETIKDCGGTGMDITIILGQMLMLFAMMAVGFVIWKIHWMDEHTYAQLSRVVVNIFNPMLVLYGIADQSAGRGGHLTQNLGMTVLFYLLLILFSFVVVWILRPAKNTVAFYRLMTVFPNTGFMGIPVITGLLGNGSMIYIVFYMLGYNLLLYTFGILLVRSASGQPGTQFSVRESMKNICNPGLIASVLALLLFWSGVQLPAVAVRFTAYLGNATIPLSMVLIGMSIAKADLRNIFRRKRIYLFTLLRMVLFPIAVILLMKRLPVDSMVFTVFALQLSMPVGSIVTLLVKQSGADETVCTSGVVLTTLLSLFTIPFVSLFL